MKTLSALLLAPLFLLGTARAQTPSPESAAQEAPPVFVIVTASNAAVRTLPDKNGPSVMAPEVGQLLQVSGEKRAAFLPVIAPGGYAVWIFGRNLKQTDEAGVLEVTANAVNQRPLPTSENKSYPLSRRLHGGDRVRVIGRADATKPLDEDWVQVWSSADSVGWILMDECRPVKTDGPKLWSEALASFGGRAAIEKVAETPTDKPKVGADGVDIAPGSAPKVAVDKTSHAAARAELELADGLLATERLKPSPDFSAVRASYDKVLALKVAPEISSRAKAGLELVTVLEAALSLESDLEAEKLRRTEQILTRQKRLWEESRQRDPLAGRFDARGVLVRQSRAGEAARYVLRWGPDQVCEVRCASGRYDLDLFAGNELGMMGALSYSEPDALLADRPVLEVGRIEVLSRR